MYFYSMLLIAFFVLGYLAIVFEHTIQLNKAASALLCGVACWTIYALSGHAPAEVGGHLSEHISEIAGILFFLLGAMTIVELIDAHDGFEFITGKIQTTNKRMLLLIVGITAFFLSAVLDNLTTAIVMVSVLRKLINDPKDRMYYAGVVIIAANAGGAWSPIGDVTTTMLWVGGNLTSWTLIKSLILPSLVALAVPMLWLFLQLKGNVERPTLSQTKAVVAESTTKERLLVFVVGVLVLLFVPFFKTITHLPPFMGVLLGVGLLWVVTEMIHQKKNDEEKDVFSVTHALRRIDTPSVLFFLGILLAIGALESAGLLQELAQAMNDRIGNISAITMSIGLASAVVDNVPLVAAAQGMYSLDVFPVDHYFWKFLAYCAGTGGSILIIGSAAGVAVMGLERIDFIWYLKKMALPALVGFFAGAFVFIALN
jgi:Na+/H+ antiporter NhaD/arsenite permease-like protein